MELKQELKMKQVLSQNMILSAKILQMGQLELREYLEDLALENPVVDLEELHPDGAESNEDFLRWLDELKSLDAQNRQYYQDEEEEAGRFEPAESSGQRLEDSLSEQLIGLKITEDERRILKYMILNLDENGYLSCDRPSLYRRLGISGEEGERVRVFFKRLEPRGAGACDLRECLLWQAEDFDAGEKVKTLAAQIISEYLEELGKNRMEWIARKLRCRLDEVLEAGRLIRSLSPRPGSSFGIGNFQKYLVPDIVVVKTEHGLEAVLNDDRCPQLIINPYYVSLLKGEVPEDAAAYIRDKVKQAEWACRCVDQRKRTLSLLAAELLTAQESFFEQGRGHLNELTQKAMAEKLGLNESTISRAVREKYLQCRWGVFPLQFFFSRGTAAAEREAEAAAEETADRRGQGKDGALGSGSAEAVKERLRCIIEKENKKKPYSDRILAEKLEEEGIRISRRTVAKYREAIGIPDASGRKLFE